MYLKGRSKMPDRRRRPRIINIDQHAQFPERFIENTLNRVPDPANQNLPVGFKKIASDHYECTICKVKLTSAGQIPEHSNGKPHILRCLNYALRKQKKNLVTNKNGVEVTSKFSSEDGYIKFDVEQNTNYKIDITVQNKSDAPVALLKCVLLKSSRIVKLRTNTNGKTLLLDPGADHTVSVTVRTRRIGRNTCPVAFMLCDEQETDRFNIVRYVSVYSTNELIKSLQPKVKYTRPPKYVHKPVSSNIVDGVKPERAEGADGLEREREFGDYYVPKHVANLLNLGFKEAEKIPDQEVRAKNEEFEALAQSPLAWDNYKEKFSALMHIEEHQMGVDIRTYDMSGVTMQKYKNNPRLLTLTVPGLAENRPSLLRGDRLFVKVHKDNKTDATPSVEYAGYAHQILETKVVLGFHQKLMALYIPNMRFDVRFSFSRHPLRMHHRAVELTRDDPGFKDVLFPTGSTHGVIPGVKASGLKLFDQSLEKNKEQSRAVKHILEGASRPAPYIIFGPPGTGKTVTMVEAMKQVWKHIADSHVLACAPSNSAADLIAQRLIKHIPKMHVFRMHAMSRVYKTIPEEIRDIGNIDEEGYVTYPCKAELQKYRLIVCTLTTAGRLASARFPSEFFSHVFMDESGHAMEPEAVTALGGILSSTHKYAQVVLCGDPRQLGPILRSPLSKQYGLGISLLERLMHDVPRYQRREGAEEEAKHEEERYDQRFITKLVMNYRSHPKILHLPNALFYNGDLRCGADQILRESMCNWERLPQKGFPLIFHGIVGEDQREEKSPSFFNPEEVSLVKDYVKELIEDAPRGRVKITPKDIGIIAPYRKQVQKIQSVMTGSPKTRDIKVGSVEEFQGQERLVIIISTVRSNPEFAQFDSRHNLGFLRNEKRFNVSVTRAKALLIVIGNPFFLSDDPHWNALLRFITDNNGYTGDDTYTQSDDVSELDDDVIKHLKEMRLDDALSGDTSDVQHFDEPQWGGNEALGQNYAQH